MINYFIIFNFISLLLFTPIAFGSMELWAFSLMELGILLILIFWAIQQLVTSNSLSLTRYSTLCNPYPSVEWKQFAVVIILLSLFLLIVLLQTIPLPSDLIKVISSKTFSLRNKLLFFNDQLSRTTLSFVPFLTRVEFFKWLTLSGFFLFFLFWKDLSEKTRNFLILTILFMGVAESLYGMFEFFSGHRHILHINMSERISSVTGTFPNRNYFAGYLLMVIPLAMGYLFYRKSLKWGEFIGWRDRLSNFDGKTILIAFGIIIMILALLFSASRMGIISLLLSFTLLSLVFRGPQKGERLSKSSVLILGLAVLWAFWIGLDEVISRFLGTSEKFKFRWVFWSNTIQILKDYPLFGSGLGTFINIFPMYRSFHTRGLATHAESDWLQLASEVGFLGTGVLLVLFIYLFYKAVSKIRSLSYEEPERYIGIGGLVGILALMFHSLVERNIQVPANAFLYTLLWAIVLRINVGKKAEVTI